METFNHLFSVTFKKNIFLVVFSVSLLMLSCEKDSVVGKCDIHGIIEAYNPNLFKVVLENKDDPAIKFYTVSDPDGTFEFQDVPFGIYSVDAIKDGDYYWVWNVINGESNHRDKLIEVKSTNPIELKICLLRHNNPDSSYGKKLSLTDLNGNPIGMTLHVPKYTRSLTFRLYNNSKENKGWYVHPDECFVSYTSNWKYYTEPVFSSFSLTSGSLEPGESIVLMGEINQKIFGADSYDASYTRTTLSFADGVAVDLDIEF